FYNTPVRKKFLKGDVTESSHISQVVTQQSLAHPEIHFTLNQNGRKVIDTLPTEHSLYRVAELFGPELTKELVRVEKSNEDYRLEGYVSNPVYTRSNRSTQFFYINKRFIRDKVIFHAIQHGFSHLLPKNRYPVLFLFLEMDPGLVDVNVHPAKAEVRFAYQQEVHRFVSEGIREGLTGNKQTSDPPLAREKRSANDPYTSRQTTDLPTEWKGRENPIPLNT
ncbi:MAG: DNA mismatch repair protein MutL, partial [bacterium]|nr:DNA mismatch repair protein MutL [bacterium]